MKNNILLGSICFIMGILFGISISYKLDDDYDNIKESKYISIPINKD